MMFRRISINNKCRRTLSTLYSPEAILSTQNKEKTISNYVKMKPIMRSSFLPSNKAAVLVPLCLMDGKVALLYTLRTSNLKKHRGQVSFPGGMQDESDKDFVETALRESQEELGLNPESVDVWCSGNQLVAKGKTTVTPIVGFIKKPFKLEDLKINQDEVEEVFYVDLESLCNSKLQGYTQFKNGFCMPVFTGGKRRIWGLTGVITHMLLKCLVPPKLYTHHVKRLPAITTNQSTSSTTYTRIPV